MKIINAKKRFLASFVIVSVLWLNYSLVSYFLRDDNNILHTYIPVDASISLRINNDILMRRMFYDLFFQSNFTDEELDRLTFKGESTTLPALGIDITQEIVLFYEDWNDKSIVGWLFHISDEETFKNYPLDDPSIITSSNGSIGCALILSDLPTKNESVRFIKYAHDLLIPSEDRSDIKLYFGSPPNNSLLQCFFEGEANGYLQKTGIDIMFEEEKLVIRGKGTKNPLLDYSLDSLHYISEPVRNEYLEITAGELPDTLRSYVNFLFESAEVQIPRISSQHVMMYGVEIDNIKGAMTILPKFDAIFRFEESFSLEDFRKTVTSVNSSNIHSKQQSFSIGNVTYSMKQLSPTEIYVGITPYPKIDIKANPNFFQLKGNLASLFTIEGTGLIAQIVQLMPEVQNSKQFLGTVEDFDIRAFVNKENQINVDGTMTFPKEKKASLEFFSYLIRF